MTIIFTWNREVIHLNGLNGAVYPAGFRLFFLGQTNKYWLSQFRSYKMQLLFGFVSNGCPRDLQLACMLSVYLEIMKDGYPS